VKTFFARHRRMLAVMAGAVLGVAGAVAVSGPASAHHSEVEGVAECDIQTGDWVVTWTVRSVAPRGVDYYRLVEVQYTPEENPVEGIAVTEGEYPHRVSEPLIGTQRLPGDAERATLSVRAQWNNRFTEGTLRHGVVEFGGPCEGPSVPPTTPPPGEPEPEPAPLAVHDAATCEDLVVHLENPEDGADVTVEVTTSAGDSETVQLAPGASETLVFPASEGLTYQVTVDGQTVHEGGWQQPEDCEIEFEAPVAWTADCENLTVEVTNPLTEYTIAVTITVGEVTEELTIEPESTAEATFPIEGSGVATITIEETTHEVEFTVPEECEPAEPAPSEEPEGPTLPVTGGRTTLIVGAAVLLLLAGGGLFWAARRRRMTFTA